MPRGDERGNTAAGSHPHPGPSLVSPCWLQAFAASALWPPAAGSGPVALACYSRVRISSWSVAEPQSQFIWLIRSRARASSTSSAALYDSWHRQQIPSSSARGAGLCPALKPAPAPQLPSALIHALPIPLCWNPDEAAAYARAENHWWALMCLLHVKMALGTWPKEAWLRQGSSQVRGRYDHLGKKSACKSDVSWKRDRAAHSLTWAGLAPGSKDHRVWLWRKVILNTPSEQAHAPSRDGGHGFLAFEITLLRKGHSLCLSDQEVLLLGRSPSYRATCLPFSIAEGLATGQTQGKKWTVPLEREEEEVIILSSGLTEILQKVLLSLPSFVSFLLCLSVILPHACPDMSSTIASKLETSLASQEGGELPEHTLQRLGGEQEMESKGASGASFLFLTLRPSSLSPLPFEDRKRTHSEIRFLTLRGENIQMSGILIERDQLNH